MQKENLDLKLIDQEIEKENELLLKKNTFILKVLNKIGCSLSKNFVKISDFNLDVNLTDFNELFDYFYSLCEKNPEKDMCLLLISYVILQTKDLNENYQNLINDIMEVVLIDNYLYNQDNRFKLLDKIKNDLKLCLSKEQNSFIMNYSKLFGLNIIILFEIMTYFFSDNMNKDLLCFTIKDLKKNYPELIISDSITDLEHIDINYLNQLLSLKFSNDSNILIFENSKFIIRKPTNNELLNYFNEDFEDKKQTKPKNVKDRKLKKQIKEENKDSNTQVNREISLQNIDYNKLTVIEKYLINALNKTKEESERTKKELKNEIEKSKNEIEKSKNEIETLKNEMKNSKMRIGMLETDLKKIKIRSLYKGIIDAFVHVYKINPENNYYNKLNDLLNELNESPRNQTIEEFKTFLLDIYSYLKKGNFLAHNIDENISPLDLIFSLLEKDMKKEYPKVKSILKKLSFDEILKYARNNYYSLKDKNDLINHIKFSLKNLQKLLVD